MRVWSLLSAAFAGLLFSQTSYPMLARISEARLRAPQRVIRLGTPTSGAPSVWVQFYSNDFREAVRTLKAALASLPHTQVQIESFYRATGEARLIVNGSLDDVLEKLSENKKIKFADRIQKIHISEMKDSSAQ